jgi:hypothetical protein
LNNDVFLDLFKAFDTNFYGIRALGLEWFNSYLDSRKQSVIYQESESDIKSISCGVLQGSALGYVYINDLPDCLTHASTIIFADDTSLCKSSLTSFSKILWMIQRNSIS